MPKMKFYKDAFVDEKIFANAGEVVEVKKESVARWLIRGAELVEEQKPQVEEVKPQPRLANSSKHGSK
jgi:hypothetical protein